LVLGFLTPLAALVRGKLPPPLWPPAPYVVVANGILVVTSHAIKKGIRTDSKNRGWMVTVVSILLPALFKFGFLTFCVKALVPSLPSHSKAKAFGYHRMCPIMSSRGALHALRAYQGKLRDERSVIIRYGFLDPLRT
jgi:hypothetical protein